MRDSTTFRARTGLRVATAWVIAGALAGFACAKDADLKSLTATHFKETAQITDDAAADRTTVSTEPGYSEHAGPLRMVWSDEYLQGVIDKKTGKSSFQVRAWVIYSGALRSYRTATYPTADGPRTVETIPLGTEERIAPWVIAPTLSASPFPSRRAYCGSSRRVANRLFGPSR